MLSLLAEIPIRFDRPGWLLLLLLLVPTFLLARRTVGGLSRAKASLAFLLRGVVIAAIAIALSRPFLERRGEGVTVTVVLDRSSSIPVPLKRSSLDFLQDAARAKDRQEDRVAVITVAKDSVISAMADSYTDVDVTAEPAELTATNLASAVRLAMAIMPQDTANRIVLATDGNETMDSVVAAAEIARANGVPIDVVPIEYDHGAEVVFDQLVAPARARQGQTAKVRMVIRAQAETTGQVRLRVNDRPLDLNGSEPGEGRAVVLEPGFNAIEQVIALDESGPHQFEAVFVPDDPDADTIERNNSAVAVTFVGGEGRVLVLDDGTASEFLVAALRESGITVDVRPPDAWLGGMVFLSAYDAIVLANVPVYAFDREQDRMLSAYVHDLGGGLVMLGGDRAFGAGGWIDSETARALPVEMNPPQTRQMPAGALALIMHSCEMAQGNYWGVQVANAAIKALSRLDYAGIVEFGMGGPGAIEGCSWAFPIQQLGDKQSALDAVKKMTIGDMPSFAPSMQLAFQGLSGVPAAQRHAIIISDGDPSPPSPQLIAQYKDARITVTTVMVGGHGTGIDRNRMRMVANQTGGRFYNVTNPKKLPQIFFKEATLVSRSLIQEGDVFQPAVASALPGPTSGFLSVPAIDGYVLTAAREGLAQTPMVIPTTDANDPLFAHWNYGLGRSIAYTSDLSPRWGARWAGWDRFRSFWEQSIRWVMRPSSPTNLHVATRTEGDLAIVEVEALEADASFLNFLRTSAVMIRPDAETEPLTLQQVGPGRYRAEFRVGDAGAYLVNIVHETGAGDARQVGSVQAAVTVPYAREFRSVKHNRALLEELAASTGGRVLEPGGDPALVALFDRADLEVPKSPKPLWDFLAMLAAIVLLLDVAARRIAVDVPALKAFFARAIGRRVEAGDGTMEAWRRARARSGGRGDDAATARAARAQRDVKFEADSAAPGPGIDIVGDAAAEGAKESRPAKPAADRRVEEPPADAGEDRLSRLKAAKRRLREGGEEERDG